MNLKLSNGHIHPTQLKQIFGSISCVQQLIIPERLNQIYIVAHRWKEEIFSFPTICHSLQANLSPASNLKGRATIVARHVSSVSILYLRLVLIDQGNITPRSEPELIFRNNKTDSEICNLCFYTRLGSVLAIG